MKNNRPKLLMALLAGLLAMAAARVEAKTIEIRNISTVNCTGTARDNQALLRTMNVLKGSKQIGDVAIDTVRGKPPALQFTFNFRWGGVSKP